MVVKKVSWSQVRDQLAGTFEGDEALIKHDVLTGAATCYQIGECAMIARRDGRELVVMCLAGKDLKKVSAVLKMAAKKAGCSSLRFHTKRPAMGRLLKPLGFECDEYIFRVAL